MVIEQQRLAGRLINLDALGAVMPARSQRLIYRWCRRYIAHYEGWDNPDLTTNGELSVLRRVMPGCHVVFDVGANVGDWTAQVLQINPAALVHCFEPSRVTFERLASRSLPPSVIRNHFGLSAESREASLFVVGSANGMNSLYRREGLEDRGLPPPSVEERVELRTLNGYCRAQGLDAIDYLKLDVEGHELDVLRGGTDLLATGRVRMVQLEYGGCNIDAHVLLKDLFDITRAWPYDWFRIRPQTVEFVPAYSQQLETFQYSNWLLARRDQRGMVGGG